MSTFSVSASRRSLSNGSARRIRALDVKRRLGRLLVLGLAAGLALFHGQLLWQRIASFTLLDPLVAIRWAAATLILAGFVYLQLAGSSVLWGHKALILWLLVLLVHAGTVPAQGYQPLAEPGLLLAISFWGFALRAILGELERLAGGRAPRPARILSAGRAAGRPREAEFPEPLSPRPPPAR